MVRKSYGKMKGARKKMRLKKKPTINTFLKKFKVGDKVSINISTGKSIPSPKFHGKTGTVSSKRGNAYEVKIKTGERIKAVFIKPEHLRLNK